MLWLKTTRSLYGMILFRAFAPLALALLLPVACLFVPAYAGAEDDADFLTSGPAKGPFSVSGQKPLLTILYSASTQGEAHPCPT